jgi:hypothetical protein
MTKTKTASRGVRLHAAALLAALAAACTPGPSYSPTDWVSLPPDAVVGAGDPTRSAILNTAYAFGTPQSLANRPAEAAVAVAQLDYLASEIPFGPRWREFDPTVGLLLRQARQEVRGYLGISQEAAPQVVVDSLYTASRALRANDRAAAERIMAPPVYPNARQTLAHLTALPLLPTANQATARAAQELDRVGRIGGRGGGGFGGGGGGRN